jgi:DUF177 domain-containing protein
VLIKIRDIPEAGLELRAPFGRALLKDALAGLDADLERSTAEAALAVMRSDDNVFVRGALTGSIRVPCARCLREVSTLVQAPLDLVFFPEGERRGAEADDVDWATHDGVAIELDDLLREALILAVPMKPLCRAECKGLCPVCGGDRNERDCGCEVKPPDPRLAALKEIKL